MIKKTLYFGNPCYLSVKDEQLVVDSSRMKNLQGHQDLEDLGIRTIPIEDIGVIELDHYGVVISQYALSSLLANNVAVIVCDKTHHPAGLLLTLSSNSLQEEIFSQQISATLPLKKQLWQQTVKTKIRNQAMLLRQKEKNYTPLEIWANEVKSDDSTNREARAARLYWDELFGKEFTRERYGAPPNNLLNYGYAILRACVARSLVGSGLLPTFGIHHHNQYNAYCLADDIMEPYRPFVDSIVIAIVESGEEITELTPSLKKKLLQIPVLDVVLNDERSPLMLALQRTTASLAKCFSGEEKKIAYPSL
jgi:CRISPR-associated protein Cas1